MKMTCFNENLSRIESNYMEYTTLLLLTSRSKHKVIRLMEYLNFHSTKVYPVSKLFR